MYTHFYFVDIFPTEHVLFVKRVLIGSDLENPPNDTKGEDE